MRNNDKAKLYPLPQQDIWSRSQKSISHSMNNAYLIPIKFLYVSTILPRVVRDTVAVINKEFNYGCLIHKEIGKEILSKNETCMSVLYMTYPQVKLTCVKMVQYKSAINLFEQVGIELYSNKHRMKYK